MNRNKVGLAVGYVLATLHLIWALAVGLIPTQTQKGIDWIMNLHGIQPYVIITGMTFLNAILLIIVTFIVGYIVGWVFAYFHNKCERKRK